MTLTLLAPMQGWAGPLSELPDAAFAGGLVGDGVAIDPTGSMLHAPCAGVVVGVHRACHAVTLRAPCGAEILCHIGIETVGLGGEGFTAYVTAGDRVAAGAPLIGFDLDILARGAISLASPILIIDSEAFRITRRASDTRLVVGDWLMDIDAVEAAAATKKDIMAPTHTREVVLPAGHGIHARPAAAIATCARGFAAEIELATTKASVSATSAVGLMTLGLAGGDLVTLNARGADAEAALDALVRLIQHGLEDSFPAPVPAIAGNLTATLAGARGGVTAVPGVAIGTIFHFAAADREPPVTGQGIAAETASLNSAIAAVRTALQGLAASALPAQAGIAQAHLTLLDDPRFDRASATALAGGASAGAAWRAALAPDIAALRALADPRIAARADDLVDLERQVIARTLGLDDAVAQLPAGAILVAQDVLPSDLMALGPARLAGVALAAGGPTSHVAIIAAALGLPMVVALGSAALALADGTAAILDADAGTLIAADAAAEQRARAHIAAAAARRATARATAATLCHMADGTRIEVFANLGTLGDADAAVAAGAEGCGLLRTELLFLDRAVAPDEAEQLALYQAIAERMAARPVIIRTLDIGGDKPVRYLPIAQEENPALGLRGIRVGLHHRDLLVTQLRAILRVAPAGQCRILVPMIASLSELEEVRRLADAAAQAIGRSAPFELGVMIETPAAAITADLLASAADFFAIGTNDLAQYTLAMDRGNPLLAPQVDALHPAVLRMVECAARAGAAHGRPVGVCGGLASDLVAAPILIGLGVSELSAVPSIIPELKALIRTLTRAGCGDLAKAALLQPSAEAVRTLVGRARA